MCSERIKADQVDSSCIFLGGVREIYETSGFLVHPVKSPATLINCKKPVIGQEVSEEAFTVHIQESN